MCDVIFYCMWDFIYCSKSHKKTQQETYLLKVCFIAGLFVDRRGIITDA